MNDGRPLIFFTFLYIYFTLLVVRWPLLTNSLSLVSYRRFMSSGLANGLECISCLFCIYTFKDFRMPLAIGLVFFFIVVNRPVISVFLLSVISVVFVFILFYGLLTPFMGQVSQPLIILISLYFYLLLLYYLFNWNGWVSRSFASLNLYLLIIGIALLYTVLNFRKWNEQFAAIP